VVALADLRCCLSCFVRSGSGLGAQAVDVKLVDGLSEHEDAALEIA
jgi:hypothetical protein